MHNRSIDICSVGTYLEIFGSLLLIYLVQTHEVRDIYVFDWFKDAAATTLVGSKMCYRIFVWDLVPSIFADTYLGWSWSAVQNLDLIAQDSANGGHFK